MAETSRVTIAGEALTLIPERAVYWAARETLLVADPHFGKAAAFRAGGIPVPRGTTAGTLARLDRAIDRTGARRIVFLGDFLHARAGRQPATIAALARWRATRADLEVLLVRGNHDLRAGDPPTDLRIRVVGERISETPFVLAHHPEISDHGYVLAGHIHPGATLTGAGRQRERFACFWFGERCGVLAAFGEFTGLAAIRPRAGDRVFVVADDTVIEAAA